jgi:hypothetical protein
MPRVLKTQSQGKVLHNSSPRTLYDVTVAVENGKWRKFTPPQRGACRRIIHDAIRILPTKYPYPSQTKAFQSEMFRLDLLLTYFDI